MRRRVAESTLYGVVDGSSGLNVEQGSGRGPFWKTFGGASKVADRLNSARRVDSFFVEEYKVVLVESRLAGEVVDTTVFTPPLVDAERVIDWCPSKLVDKVSSDADFVRRISLWLENHSDGGVELSDPNDIIDAIRDLYGIGERDVFSTWSLVL